MRKRTGSVVVGILVWVLAAGGGALAERAPKVVVIGFDGADPNLVNLYLEQGKLPNISRLQEEGTFSALTPTNPPQTPVSWSTFATGLNPGRTEIFDFLQRREGQYVPDLALATPGRKTLLYGERNGMLLGIAAGALVGLPLLLLLKLFRVRWLVALGAALLAAAGSAVALAGPLGQLLPAEVPTATNNRQGTPFWTIAARNGMKVKVTHVPVTFPAEELPEGSRMISGLGVPDMRGRVGTPSLYTSDPRFDIGDNQFSLEPLRLAARRGAIETTVIGPFNYPFHQYALDRAREGWTREGISAADRKAKEKELTQALESHGVQKRIDLPLQLNVTDTELSWEVSGQKGTLKPGEWSDWVVFDFPLNWLVDWAQPLRGMGRFKLIRLDPEIELYLSPINFHPTCHPIAYSWPPEWAKGLSGDIGLFKTIGWTIDTWSYPSGVGGIDLFLEDMWATVEASERIMEASFRENDADVIVQVFDFTDRAGHMLWHELDDGHPLFKPELAPKYRAAMEATYVKMDELIGRARELAGPEALFVVLSDHGFSSFRRQINYNTWLYKNGYLTLKGKTRTRNLEQLFDKDVSGVDVFSGIDWSRTKAWAMGLGSVYINLVGREPQGIVMPGEEYEKLVQELKEGLQAEIDPVTGEAPVFKVYHRDEIYEGYDPNKIPDLRPSNRLNYRVSWQDTLGGLATEVFEDNDRVWSGDHCSLEPSLVPGILIVNRKLSTDGPRIIDIAPSILAALKLEPDAELDGRVIW